MRESVFDEVKVDAVGSVVGATTAAILIKAPFTGSHYDLSNGAVRRPLAFRADVCVRGAERRQAADVRLEVVGSPQRKASASSDLPRSGALTATSTRLAGQTDAAAQHARRERNEG